MRWIDWQQSNQIHKGVCSCSCLSDYNLFIMQGKQGRFHHWHTMLPPPLSGQGHHQCFVLHYDFITRDQVTEWMFKQQVAPSPPFSLSSFFLHLPPPLPFLAFVKCMNAWMWMKSLGNIFISISDVFLLPCWRARMGGGGSSKETPSKFYRNHPGQSLMDCPPWRMAWKWLPVLSAMVIQCKTLQG